MSDAGFDRLRAAWAAVPPSGRSMGCAPPEEIWAAVQGERNEDAVRTLLDHSIGCADCASLWRLARELTGDAGAGAEVTPLVAPAARGRWFAGAGALLAAAALVIALVPRLLPSPPAAQVRGGEVSTLRPVAGAALLQRAHPVLRWTGAPEGSRYAVTVSTSDLTVLYRANGLTAAELALPPEAVVALPPGAEIVWRVEASLPDGGRLTSGAFLSRVE